MNINVDNKTFEELWEYINEEQGKNKKHIQVCVRTNNYKERIVLKFIKK